LLPANESLRLVLVLPLRNLAGLDRFLTEVYDPSSPQYRHFLTVEEFTAKFGPRQADYDTVIQFAEAHGMKCTLSNSRRMNALSVVKSPASSSGFCYCLECNQAWASCTVVSRK
jgi:subtilase family serine protease